MTTIFTIGYGNRNIHNFLNLISGYGINLLIDVRTNPISRFQPSYNKMALTASLLSSGIEYAYMGDSLGGKPKDQSLYTNGKLNYNSVKATSTYKAAIAKIIDLGENKNICLMCCELHPEQCHRKNLIATSLSVLNVNILHIDGRGLITSHHNSSTLDLF